MKMKNPHDNYFQEIFEEKARAIELMKVALPSEVSRILNYNTVQKENDNFRDENMKKFHSDILFSMETKKQSKLKVYILFEHKSYIDGNINTQIFSYLARIYSKMKTKVPIIPIIFSHAERKWSISLKFIDEFDLSNEEREIFTKYIPNFKSEIIDLYETEVENIISSLTFKAILYTFKNIRDFENIDKIEKLILLSKELFYEKSGMEIVQKLMMYIYSTNDIEVDVIREKVSQKISYKKGAEIMTTTAERLMEKGREQGVVLGIEKGIEKGEKKKSFEIAISLLGLLGNEVISQKTGLTIEEVNELEKNLPKH